MAAPLLLGYDGTPDARAALDESIRLARDLGAELVVAFAYGTTPVGGEIADLEAALRERGEAVTGEGVQAARAAGIQARAVLVDDTPGEGLADLADDLGAQMVVVGNRGMGPLRGAIIGSTPHRLLHLSRVPVHVTPGFARDGEAPRP